MALIFVPRETEPGERRVAATPETVRTFVKNGLEVRLEAAAGTAAGFQDAEYQTAGATLGEAWDADLVLAVRPPALESIARMRAGGMIACGLQPVLQLDAVRAFGERALTAFSLDLVPRITRAQKMDVLSSQATVAGYQAVLLAAVELPRMFPLLMTAAGTIRPAKVFVLGAGVAGLQAIATAKRLGAAVEANDVRPAVKEQVESLGAKFVDTGTPPDAETAGGYAKEATDEYLRKQREILTAHVSEADVVITTALIPGKKAPVIVTADMVRAMKPGSVVVDLAAQNGGNVEGTVAGERVDVHGVRIIGDTDLASQVAADASRMWARNVAAFVEPMVQNGQIQPSWDDEILTASCVTRDGEILHAGAKAALGAS